MSGEAVITLAIAIIGAICGVLGAVLGVINTWHSLNQSAIKLKVIPKLYFATDGSEGLSIDIINLSSFAVTICDSGFFFNSNTGKRTSYPRINLNNLPVRLEARENLSVFFPLESLTDIDFGQIKDAYCMTSCNTIKRGTSPALKQIIRERGL